MKHHSLGMGAASFRKLIALFAILLLTVIGAPREGQAATITPDAGWVYGDISSTTDLVAFDFTLASDGIFSLTDCCLLGDTWTISGSFAGVSSVGLAAISVPLGIGVAFSALDPSWLDPLVSHFQIALAAGSYSIFVSGDGGGGLAALFGVRVDTAAIPVPAAGLMLLSAMGGLAALSRRRKSGKLA